MNKVICPVSSERIQAHLPRVTAFFVVSSILTYVITGWSVILIFLLADFAARATNNGKFSIIFQLAVFTSKALNLKSSAIDKAPKVFAARLGALMFLGATILHLTGLTEAAYIITLLVAILASLECAFNFCVGCVIYSAIVFPFFAKQ